MSFFWILRFGIIVVCLSMFIRRANWAWAAGLLTASVVVVLDALRMRELLIEAGYLGWLLGGLVAGGGFLWLTGLFRPNAASPKRQTTIPSVEPAYNTAPAPAASTNSAIDRQMLFNQIRNHLGPDDVYDLIFDLNLNENSIIAPANDMRETIIRLMDAAEQKGQIGHLATSVERVLTPIPKENLPRLERLSAETPPHLLRQTIIANFTFSSLDDLCTMLGIDWQEMGSDAKKSRVRRLLQYLQRRNRLQSLIDLLHSHAAASQ